MFNSTHTFIGLAISRTGFDRWVPYAAATAVIATNLPDIEIFSGLSGTGAYLDHHRGITHSFIGVPILALLLSTAMYFFSGKFWRTFVLALTVMATHPLLDYTNTYGLRPFLPFGGAWYYGDLLFIFDLYIDSVLLAGILAGTTYKNHRRTMAWISLILAVAYIGARIELRSLASRQMKEFAERTPGSEEWALLPTMGNPFAWEGVLRTRTEFVKVRVDALHGVGRQVARIDRGASSEIVKHAEQAESAAALLRFARFPAIRVEGMQSGYRVLIFDFRFYNEVNKTALGAEIMLDPSFQVTKESLSFAQSVR